jgi:S-adenosylmethionine:diacylglycerol 3-amino-3-carboxypropyl transferase
VDEQRQNAYRFLLYQAMLEIRPLQYFSHRQWWGLSPVYWRRQFQRVRVAGALAEWLHNMAQFSGNGFQRFDEQRFWQEYERLCKQYPGFGLERYQDLFERKLVELRTGKWPNPDGHGD